MIQISFHGDRVRFEVEGWDKLWALSEPTGDPTRPHHQGRSGPRPSRTLVARPEVDGDGCPRPVAAGTFFSHGELVFWDLRDPANTIIVSLDHERYER